MLRFIGVIILVIASNLYLQMCQNDLSSSLAVKFAFSWHVQKFFLGCFVLLLILLLLISVCGSFLTGSLLYSFAVAVLGFANYLKMAYREEPIYPDDLKMITEVGLLKEMAGTGPFFLILFFAAVVLGFAVYQFIRSLKLRKKVQGLRIVCALLCTASLAYISDFNNPDNLLRQAYNKTALWIPYSQKMNYYNVGFVGGFLYNLNVEAMEKPEGYSEEAVNKIVSKYQKMADETNKSAEEEKPNIIYIMSESFSDPARLAGITVEGEPLKDYYAMANQTYSGLMLSQNYGGGTANIEFEALTSFSMEPLNAQMTTPYTMLVSNLDELPSLVSVLKNRGYDATAIHPWNTSMYKRQDVYRIMGFDDFLDQDTMKHTDTIDKNQYISDASAYQEIMDILEKGDQPQFVHLVTMQTHMPYARKYSTIDYSATGNDNSDALNNYLQDVAYSSEALKSFLEGLKDVERRTLVVFWGDHLPGIYSQEIQDKNQGSTLHETQFLMYDSAGELAKKDTSDAVTSPFYYAPNLMSQTNQATTGFYELLLELEEAMPAFEKELYYNDKSNQWFQQAKLTNDQKKLYEEYQMIQYDILSGKQYSLKTNFFEG